MKVQLMSLAAAASLAVPAITFGHAGDADLAPRVENGRIVVDAWDDDNATIVATDERVFAYEVGTIFDPFFVGDPGFNVRPNNGFAPNALIGFEVVSGLFYWDGEGDTPNFTGDHTNRLEFSFGSARSVVTGSTTSDPGFFFLQLSGPNNTAHDHLGSDFSGPGATDPDEGIYATTLRVRTNQSGIAPSEDLFLVYNVGGDEFEPAHEAAIEFIEENNAIPEPGTLALAGVVGGLSLLRRRRAS